MEISKIVGVSLLSLAILFLLTKLMGNKQISQMNLFDYINGITIGSIAAELATELEEPLRPVTAMVVYGLAAVVISLCAAKSNRLRALFSGKPIVLLQNGTLSKKKLKKANLDLNEFLAMARLSGFYDLSQVHTAVFEQNGNVSFLPKAAYRPASPGDLKIPVEDETLLANVIVDGCVMERELKLMGKDPQWLRRQLEAQRYGSAKEIFLGTLDRKDRLTLFPMEK